MDKNKVKLIFSERCNQFYKPIRIDEDVGIVYMQMTKNRHDKGMTKEEIVHIEKNRDYDYVIMYNENITAEQHFIDVMNGNCNANIKLNELKYFKRNMLMDSEQSMQILEELSKSECNPKNKDYKKMSLIHNEALKLYTSLNHRKIICDNRSTYINQNIPDDIRKIALSKRLFVERADDYSNKGKNRHPSTRTDRLAIQALYPCGFIIRDRGGIVIAGGRYEMSMENAIEFVKNYIPTEKEKHYSNLYKVPISSKKKKQLAMCYKILQTHELHYKNEHNYFFWILDKEKNIVAGGKNGLGFKWLLNYCKKLRHSPISNKN